ncbi:hypothetical protein [Mycobacterium uberis]|uniref:hypothetical protein n=1 Tax=Mycobacterium uberis TaxID=2162698 RepID=UPI003C777F82
MSSDRSTPTTLAEVLDTCGRATLDFSVLEQLGDPANIAVTAARGDGSAQPPRTSTISTWLWFRYLRDERTSLLLGDVFVHDGQLTKHRIRVVTLAALVLRPGQQLYRTSAQVQEASPVEWCRSWRICVAVAFERDERRCRNIGLNAAVFDLEIDMCAAAPSVIFVVGSLTQPGLLDVYLDRLPANGRLAVNVVTAESEAFLTQLY